jgi:hypothetical protein
MQGILPWEYRAGVALWQTSSVPIDASTPDAVSRGKDGGTTTPIRTARRTTRAFHLMAATIEVLIQAVNVKL